MIERQAANQPATGVTMKQDGRDSFRSAAIDGMMLRSGVVNVDKPAAGAHELRGMSLLDLAKESLRIASRAGGKAATAQAEWDPIEIRSKEDLRKFTNVVLNQVAPSFS